MLTPPSAIICRWSQLLLTLSIIGSVALFRPAIESVLVVGAEAPADRDHEARFQAARPELVRQLRRSDPESRRLALEQLSAYPCVSAAKLALTATLEQNSVELHRTAVATLMQFRNAESVCDYFHSIVARDLQSRDPLPSTNTPRNGILLCVLLASDLPQIRQELDERLERLADSDLPMPVVWIALADQLGSQTSELGIEILARLAKTQAFARHYGFRRAVIGAMIETKQQPVIDLLVSLLATTKGETKGDIVRSLNRLRGDAADSDPNVPSYYKIAVHAQRIVFILDSSNSMAGRRYVRAQETLTQAIQDLPEDTQFNVISFHHAVYEWQRKLAPANFANKTAAVRFIRQQTIQSDTASYEALKAAFRYDTEAIYFVTDGEPTVGRIRHPRDIIQAINLENYARRITLNTIGIAVGPPGNNFDSFLKELALQNRGEYRRVDE